MGKHIKTVCGRPIETAKDANWKRRQRRKRQAAKRRSDFVAGWIDRARTRNTAEMSV